MFKSTTTGSMFNKREAELSDDKDTAQLHQEAIDDALELLGSLAEDKSQEFMLLALTDIDMQVTGIDATSELRKVESKVLGVLRLSDKLIPVWLDTLSNMIHEIIEQYPHQAMPYLEASLGEMRDRLAKHTLVNDQKPTTLH